MLSVAFSPSSDFTAPSLTLGRDMVRHSAAAASIRRRAAVAIGLARALGTPQDHQNILEQQRARRGRGCAPPRRGCDAVWPVLGASSGEGCRVLRFVSQRIVAAWPRGLIAAGGCVLGLVTQYSQSRSETRLSEQKRKTRFQSFVPSPCNLFSLPGWFVWIIIRCAGTWDGATSQQTPLSAAVWSATGGGERLQPPGAACDRSVVRWRTVLPDCASRSARTIHPLGKGHHKPILPWDTKLERLEVWEQGRVVGATRRRA